MTTLHFLFIPSVLLLGFLLGRLSLQRSERLTVGGKAIDRGMWTLIAAALVFVAIFVATHVFAFFGGAGALHIALHGQPLFDQSPSFSPDEVYHRLLAFGQSGRAMYQRFTYTADLLFPLSALVFFVVFAWWVGTRFVSDNIWRRVLLLIPIGWFLSDMLENGMTYQLLVLFPTENKPIARYLAFITTLKFCLFFLSMLTPVLFVARAKRKAANSP